MIETVLMKIRRWKINPLQKLRNYLKNNLIIRLYLNQMKALKFRDIAQEGNRLIEYISRQHR